MGENIDYRHIDITTDPNKPIIGTNNFILGIVFTWNKAQLDIEQKQHMGLKQ